MKDFFVRRIDGFASPAFVGARVGGMPVSSYCGIRTNRPPAYPPHALALRSGEPTMKAMETVRCCKVVKGKSVTNKDAIRTSRIGYMTGKRSNASHSPEWGVPGGDLWAFDTMSRRAYPAPAGTKTGD